MNNKLLLCVLLLGLAACSDSNEKKHFMEGCVGGGASKSICSCAHSEIENKFTIEELDSIDRNQGSQANNKKYLDVGVQAAISCQSK